MRRIVVALVTAVLASARFASGAAISVAGAECGSPPLLGLTVTVPASGTNITGSACPDGSFGAIFGGTGTGDGALYGSPVQTVDFSFTGDVNQLLANFEFIPGSAFDTVTQTRTGFRLSGTGILACLPSPESDSHCFTDALVTFRDFPSGTSLQVTAVNGITAVPEPATSALLVSGLGAALIRRRRRGRRS
jgi:hypothetical protein